MLSSEVKTKPSGRFSNSPAIGVPAVLLITIETVPTGNVDSVIVEKSELRHGIYSDAVGDDLSDGRCSEADVKKPSESKVSWPRIVRTPGLPKLAPGVRNPPLPGDASSYIHFASDAPVSAECTRLTKTGPLPVAEPVMLSTSSVPSRMVVPPL